MFDPLCEICGAQLLDPEFWAYETDAWDEWLVGNELVLAHDDCVEGWL